MVEKAGHEDEVDWNGVLEPAERHRIHERIHSAFGAVGARIPDTVVSGGRKLRLKDVVLSYIDKERLTPGDLQAVEALMAALKERVDELDRDIMTSDISEKCAVDLMREVLGILRALDHLRRLREDPKKAGLARAALLERVDDEKRWQDFLRQVR